MSNTKRAVNRAADPVWRQFFSELGKAGGLKRMSNLSDAERKKLATDAAAKRWEGHEKKAPTKETPAE